MPAVLASSLDITALLEFSRLLNASDDPDEIFGNVLLSLMGKLGVTRAAIAVPAPPPADADQFRFARLKGPIQDLDGTTFVWGRAGAGLLAVDAVANPETRDLLRRSRIDLATEVAYGGEILALALMGSPLDGRQLDQDEVNYTLLIGAITASALDACRTRGSLRTANRMLERQVHRLRSLFETGRAFTTLLNRGDILRLLGYTLMGEMAIGRFAVAVRDSGGFHVVVNRFPREPGLQALEFLAASGSIMLEEDERDPIRRELVDCGVRAAVPMEVQGESRGLLLIGPRLQGHIDDQDLDYLSSLANLAVTSLENVRLLEEMIEKNRMEEDLRIASEIQRGLLPATLPELEGYQIAARTIPTHQVGGDCYDVIDLGDGRVLLSIADVSGKGTPASLLMANVQAALRTLARLDLPLVDLVGRINDVIYQNTAVDKFITAFFGVLDTRDGSFNYVNAGHNPPYILSQRGFLSLDSGGLLLGVIPTSILYEQGSERLDRGDLLVLYTDGVSECLDPDRQEYGTDRLQAVLAAAADGTADSVLDKLRLDLQDFARGAQQYDDITLLVVRRC